MSTFPPVSPDSPPFPHLFHNGIHNTFRWSVAASRDQRKKGVTLTSQECKGKGIVVPVACGIARASSRWAGFITPPHHRSALRDRTNGNMYPLQTV